MNGNLPEQDDKAASLLTTGTAVLPDGGPRTVRLRGRDAQDFLQRLTTNDIRLLTRDTSLVTALLTPVGRIRIVFTVMPQEDGFLLIAPPHGSEDLRLALQAQIFFMDEVTVADGSDRWHCLQLAGPDAHRVLALLGFADVQARDGAISRAGGMICLYQARLELPGYLLLVPPSQQAQVLHSIRQAHGQQLPTREPWHLQRIRAGRGGFGTEFNADHNPLEVGLAWICAENKGCYPGQEVIARQITYGKVTRQLVQLEAGHPIPPGADVLSGTARAGTVTSAATDPDTQRCHALAVVRRNRMAAGTPVRVEGQEVQMVAVPAALPA